MPQDSLGTCVVLNGQDCGGQVSAVLTISAAFKAGKKTRVKVLWWEFSHELWLTGYSGIDESGTVELQQYDYSDKDQKKDIGGKSNYSPLGQEL